MKFLIFTILLISCSAEFSTIPQESCLSEKYDLSNSKETINLLHNKIEFLEKEVDYRKQSERKAYDSNEELETQVFNLKKEIEELKKGSVE